MVSRIDELGGPTLHNNYPWGWTMAGNTPLRRWKREVHEGGIADPCIVHFPERIAARGAIRRQFVHAIDIAPTIYDVVGVEPPSTLAGVVQRPLDGQSFAATFDDAGAQTRRTQYFEMLGSRAIYDDGWKAVAWKALGPLYSPDDDPDMPFEDDVWELFHVAEDFSESHDLAADEPERLQELIDLWWAEAERNHVLPLDNRPAVAILEPPPTGIPERTRYVYRPGGARVPEDVAVNVRGRSHRVTAEVEIPPEGAEGVLLAQGSRLGGFTLFVQDGRLQYVHNYVGRAEHHLAADAPLEPGPHTLAFAFDSDGIFQGGRALLEVDGRVVARADVDRFTPMRFSITDAGLTCGTDPGSSVTPRYTAPFAFTGTLHRVVVDVDPAVLSDVNAYAEAAVQNILAEQ
jgi:arylsulfatase